MVSLFIHKNAAKYFDSFRVDCIPQEVSNKIRDKSITNNIFRTKYNESVMCGNEFVMCGATNTVKSSDREKYVYSGYGIVFYSAGS